MSKLSKTFVKSTAQAFTDPDLQKMVGENFPKVEAVVKAAIGINDTDALAKIIMTLIPGLDMSGLAAVKHAVSNPITTLIVMRNMCPDEEEEDEQ